MNAYLCARDTDLVVGWFDTYDLPEMSEPFQLVGDCWTLREHKEADAKVHAAYKKFKKARRQAKKEGTTIPIDSIAVQSYKLFCSDHVELFDVEGYFQGRKVVQFYPSKAENGKKMVDGYVYPDSEANLANLALESFSIPTRARRKNVKVKGLGFPVEDVGILRFQFFGKGYLKLSIPRNLVWGSHDKASWDIAPEVFQFVGILIDEEKERKEREELQNMKSMKSNQPSSPKESWFNMNHPMGAYYLGGLR